MIRPPAINGVLTWPDGREECESTTAGRAAYSRRTEEMAARQQWYCAICPFLMGYPTFDHQDGRGMGGSRRDDRIEIGGDWYNASLCEGCNSQKGSKRYHWIYDGSKRVYVPEA